MFVKYLFPCQTNEKILLATFHAMGLEVGLEYSWFAPLFYETSDHCVKHIILGIFWKVSHNNNIIIITGIIIIIIIIAITISNDYAGYLTLQ